MNSARAASIVFACIVIAACSVIGGTGRLDDDTAGVMRASSPSVTTAQAAVRPGASTRAQVTAALGPATVVRFDSGWEVWVYRWPGATRTTASATELVILFDSSGLARKVRVRHAT
ncbi:MAG TPA: hypothetical protein VK996_02705 [Ramlibacter sp.]|nr:hypothetical protein [Ramlibacter sp.]